MPPVQSQARARAATPLPCSIRLERLRLRRLAHRLVTVLRPRRHVRPYTPRCPERPPPLPSLRYPRHPGLPLPSLLLQLVSLPRLGLLLTAYLVLGPLPSLHLCLVQAPAPSRQQPARLNPSTHILLQNCTLDHRHPRHLSGLLRPLHAQLWPRWSTPLKGPSGARLSVGNNSSTEAEAGNSNLARL